jgi:hypothetical protein
MMNVYEDYGIQTNNKCMLTALEYEIRREC